MRKLREIGIRLLLVASFCLWGAACSSSEKESGPLQKMVDALARDGVGAVVAIKDRGSAAPIIVFEEAHASLVGNVEIAIMLNRLVRDYGVTQIGAEGAFDALDESWFRALVGEDSAAQAIAAQHLAEGEISSVELVALLYPAVTVQGLDDPAEYEANLADAQAGGAAVQYFLAFAAQKMGEAERQQAETIRSAQGEQAYIDTMLGFDPWSQQRYQVVYGSGIAPAEDVVRVLDEVIARGEALGLPHLQEFETDQAALLKERAFYAGADQRTQTIFNRVLELAQTVPGVPLPVVIGIAHTPRLVELLDQTGTSYIVLQAASLPAALARDPSSAVLDDTAFSRKFAGQSVDADGHLGALLEGRVSSGAIRPLPASKGTNYQRKALCYKALDMLGQLLRGREATAPASTPLTGLDETLRAIQAKGVQVIGTPAQVQADLAQPTSPTNQALLFQVQVPETTVNGVTYPAGTFWAKVAAVSPESLPADLEMMLLQLRQRTQQRASTSGDTLRVSGTTRAVVGTTREAVLAQSIDLSPAP